MAVISRGVHRDFRKSRDGVLQVVKGMSLNGVGVMVVTLPEIVGNHERVCSCLEMMMDRMMRTTNGL